MKILRSIAAVREALAAERQSGARIGFVPTMGYFHEGHLTLMRRAKAQCGFCAVSLFVNPTQFNDPRDLDAYPRDEARDAEMAESAGADLLFAPTVAELYPAGHSTRVSVGGVTAPLEGVARGVAHFDGVATIVTKLFNIVQPDVAFFGQKDAQQALVIRRMVRDLDLPLRIEVVPTVREADGLAMSSRNVRLDAPARQRALGLVRALEAVAQRVAEGVREADSALASGFDVLARHGITGADVEYLAAVDAETLGDVETFRGPTLVAVAARVGGVRLIDNIIVTP